MKGLMFNMLETLASTAHCSADAWELVAEFAAAEGVLSQVSRGANHAHDDVHPPELYQGATSAMLSCLLHNQEGGDPLELLGQWPQDDFADALAMGYDALPHMSYSGFGATAFHDAAPEGYHPELLEFELEDEDDCGEIELDDLYDFPFERFDPTEH